MQHISTSLSRKDAAHFRHGSTFAVELERTNRFEKPLLIAVRSGTNRGGIGMAARLSFALVLLGSLLSMGASYSTPNFVVEAPTQQIAEQVGQYAEQYRREKAKQWLGQEMPQ